MFPIGNHVFLKDCCEGGGGVFLCAKDEFSASEVQSLVWVKVTLAKNDSIVICSYYCPPNIMQQSLLQLTKSLKK